MDKSLIDTYKEFSKEQLFGIIQERGRLIDRQSAKALKAETELELFKGKWAISTALEKHVSEQLTQVRREKEDFRNKLEDVVNELDLSHSAIEKHGPLGTAPAELVRLTLNEKDLKIRALKAGFKDITPEQP